jgi:2-amino-4-hydroxy-6-hydroxymethyldihydropteridine diphosphokinase
MSTCWTPAYVGMGSNLDDPPRQLRAALEALAGLPGCLFVAASAFYRSPPMGPAGQPHYVNAVAGMLTTLSPEAMLERLQAIEAAQGRRRDGPRWGPRTLDLDLLAHGQYTRQTQALALPHPGVGVRPFVLVPLAELAPGLSLPGLGRIASLAARVEKDGIVRLEAP